MGKAMDLYTVLGKYGARDVRLRCIVEVVGDEGR